MRPNWFRSFSVLALLLTTSIVGCERSTNPMEVASKAEFSAHQAGLSRVRGAAPDRVPTTMRVIGYGGGTIEHAGHRLTVPAGAVAAPTRFSITTIRDGFVEVELKATSLGNGSETNDVGSRGFMLPLTLELSYTHTTGTVNPSGLVVAWVREDGSLEATPGYVDPSTRRVAGKLEHFSRYVIASN